MNKRAKLELSDRVNLIDSMGVLKPELQVLYNKAKGEFAGRDKGYIKFLSLAALMGKHGKAGCVDAPPEIEKWWKADILEDVSAYESHCVNAFDAIVPHEEFREEDRDQEAMQNARCLALILFDKHVDTPAWGLEHEHEFRDVKLVAEDTSDAKTETVCMTCPVSEIFKDKAWRWRAQHHLLCASVEPSLHVYYLNPAYRSLKQQVGENVSHIYW